MGKGRSEIAAISKIVTIDAPASRVRGKEDLKGFGEEIALRTWEK